eukprot:gene7299-8075_t
MTYEAENGETCTLGKYLTERLVQAGANSCFTVPGDFTLTLLDEITKEKDLQLVRCCNELNAGYAADGYSRATGLLTVLIVTYMVGSLSAINAVAGAYAEDLPLLVLVGGPNNLDRECCHLVHHTLGETDFYRSAKCFEPVTVGAFTVRYIREATKKIDEAVKLCITRRKPVYLEIACNLFSQIVSKPQPARLAPEVPIIPNSDEVSLGAALECIHRKVNMAEKVVLIAGPKLKAVNATEHFNNLARSLNCPVVVSPDAKGLFNEFDENFIGIYWGSLSGNRVQRAIDEADLLIYCGPVFSDYVTTGWTAKVANEKSIILAVDHVHVQSKRFSYVCMTTVLARLIEHLPEKGNFIGVDESIAESEQQPKGSDIMDSPLALSFLQDEIQLAVGSAVYSNVVAETGDCWFIAEKLKIPQDTNFFIQMQYGSIGWALAALVGIGLMNRQRSIGKTLALIGDGSFQVSVQELSTLIAEQLDVTIILINNASYAIEQQIHKGPYNELVSWKYAQLTSVFRGDEPAARSYVAKTNSDLVHSLRDSQEHYGVALIECLIDQEDCTMELRKWGELIAQANSRER